MALNSSSSSNNSALHSQPNHELPFYLACFMSELSTLNYTVFYLTNILLLLPLCIFILYLGLQQWWQQRSTSTAPMMSHSDCFTYHLVIKELVGVAGSISICCGFFKGHLQMMSVGYFLYSFTWYGQVFFHMLTCVERYLAVVHPITYLSLKRERGVGIRNISIGCAWFLCIGATIMMYTNDTFFIWELTVLALIFFVIVFCSLSVLCILIRPGPGKQGGEREKVDQSKQRAFHTIVAILGVLLLRWLSSLLWASLFLVKADECVVNSYTVWLNAPSSLVLPLLFLHRAGKLTCFNSKK